MRIVIAGGSGWLGQPLATKLIARGDDVVVLSRRRGASRPSYREVQWTPDGSIGPWAREIAESDVVINLAGTGIADKRWSKARKADLLASRVNSTTSLVAAVHAADHRPSVFVQGSAVGYYGASLDARILDEGSPPGQDFLADLAVEWEDAAKPVATLGCRLVIIRTGLVLARDGGALAPMARPFRFFVGGPVGSGRQYMSWITREDWLSLIVWAIDTPTVDGAINAAAPTAVTNAAFSAALGRALARPSWLPAPAFALRAMFGQMATSILLNGQRVAPARALALGFRFRNETLDDALANALRG